MNHCPCCTRYEHHYLARDTAYRSSVIRLIDLLFAKCAMGNSAGCKQVRNKRMRGANLKSERFTHHQFTVHKPVVFTVLGKPLLRQHSHEGFSRHEAVVTARHLAFPWRPGRDRNRVHVKALNIGKQDLRESQNQSECTVRYGSALAQALTAAKATHLLLRLRGQCGI